VLCRIKGNDPEDKSMQQELKGDSLDARQSMGLKEPGMSGETPSRRAGYALVESIGQLGKRFGKR
jgi:hypothetical protein